jgi:acyl-coenzyme A thioesterase PaaI-like protein
MGTILALASKIMATLSGSPLSVQQQYAPANRCFGCGPSNPQGLRIGSFRPAATDKGGSGDPDELIATFRPAPHHLAFQGIVNGGIIGAILDCHSNWTAAMALMRRSGAAAPPYTVTADFHVRLKRPTPLDAVLLLRAHPVEISDDRATIEATLEAAGQITATCRGTFVAVKEGHPAHNRW